MGNQPDQETDAAADHDHSPEKIDEIKERLNKLEEAVDDMEDMVSDDGVDVSDDIVEVWEEFADSGEPDDLDSPDVYTRLALPWAPPYDEPWKTRRIGSRRF